MSGSNIRDGALPSLCETEGEVVEQNAVGVVKRSDRPQILAEVLENVVGQDGRLMVILPDKAAAVAYIQEFKRMSLNLAEHIGTAQPVEIFPVEKAVFLEVIDYSDE